MRWFGLVCATVCALFAGMSSAAAKPAPPAFTLTAHSQGGRYAPTFTGNGFLGVRVPADGQGYAGGTVPAQSELAGFYAVPAHPQKPSDAVQQRANIPTWSTLTFSVGGQGFTPGVGRTTAWQQSVSLQTGLVTTSATWVAPNGDATKLVYEVFTDRANPNVAVVHLFVTPRWTGTATVTDEIDGTPANLTNETGKGFTAVGHQQYVAVTAQGTGIEAAIATQLSVGANVVGTPTEVDAGTPQTVGQQISFPVDASQTYEFTKFVGVADSQDAADPVAAAQAAAAAAAGAGYQRTLSQNDAAWAALWRGRIDVLGDRTLATDVNASEFYLWSSTRAGVDWSVSPAGLSSNGYDGHIFWDAETWMYPSLLAQHPDLAAGMNAYRFQRLSAAQQHAAQTGYAGARFPWESALDGTEQIPPPTSVNSEGLYEMHITADIALAQWQYYLATGDRSWLAGQGWPVISGAATFWASKATRGADGKYHIDGVTGPDEENPNVNDEAYTNVAAKTVLADAVAAARVIGQTPPANWSAVAAGLTVPTTGAPRQPGVSGAYHPEFSGYKQQLVKQADVTLLQYPWLYPMSKRLATNDLNFYVPRTDPGGPSMSDAVNSIDSSTLGTPGCASFVYVERSYQPFIRDVFDQFSETRTGGAFTFMTGIGGFLQEFLYGFSGIRWDANAVRIAPSLTAQLGGVVLHRLQWRGRTFDVSIGQARTTVRLDSGAPLPVVTPTSHGLVRAGHPLQIRTARPDLALSNDVAQCAAATASSSQPGAPALAAVDGSPATDWQPARLPATLTVPLGVTTTLRSAQLVWARQWPEPPKTPNVPPPPGPVKVLRPAGYIVQVSSNRRRWRTVARVSGHASRVTDTVPLRTTGVRFVRVRLTGSAVPKTLPELEELSVTR